MPHQERRFEFAGTNESENIVVKRRKTTDIQQM